MRSASQPKDSASLTQSGFPKERSVLVPKWPRCFQAMRPYSPSSQTIATMGRLRRTAVSISCTFIRKPPSPEMESTLRSGKASCAPMEPGRAKPMVQYPLEIKQVFGSWHW